MTVYVAFLLTQAANAADGSAGGYVPPPPAPPVSIGVPGTTSSYAPPSAPHFRDTQFGAYPTPGSPGSPGFPHPHLMEQQTRYGIWYQPRSFHEPMKEVYRPSPFRPRGWGNLFYDPCRHDRIDYARYTVKDLPSQYGPAYYPNYVVPSECMLRPERCYKPPVYGDAE